MDDSKKAERSPATTSLAYKRMAPRWNLISSLLGGTETMREAGEAYLPKHTEETDENYQARLEGATLNNITEQTLDALAAKPFTDPLKINEDVPAQLQSEVLDDVDLQGNNLHVFSSRWFRAGVAKALAHVLVDFPRPAPETAGRPRTLADDRREGRRPYWVLIQPEAVLFARAQIVNGVEVLQHVRILETYTEQVGFAEIVRQRIRVLTPGLVEIYQPVETKKQNGEVEWVRSDEWATGLDIIPLVTFYADREGLCEGKPPLLDLAYLNVTHWQSTSEQRHILSVSRFPILACSGSSADDSDPIVIGPNRVLYNEDAQGKFYYVEHGGGGIEAGRKDLEDLERQMSNYGAEFLKKRPGTATATARALDSAESASELQGWAVSFEDAVAQALGLTALWMGLGTSGGTVEVVKEYELNVMETGTLDFWKSLREKNDISRKALLQFAQMRGLIPEDYDAEADWEQIENEIAERSELLGEAMTDLDPAAPKGGEEGEEGEGEGEGGEE